MQRRLLLSIAVLALVEPMCQAEPAELEINSASQAQLESMPGIGPALAERILAARSHAPFEDWADLRHRVAGMGPKVAKKLSGLGLRVNGLPFAG